jgi:hypothetical protein
MDLLLAHENAQVRFRRVRLKRTGTDHHDDGCRSGRLDGGQSRQPAGAHSATQRACFTLRRHAVQERSDRLGGAEAGQDGISEVTQSTLQVDTEDSTRPVRVGRAKSPTPPGPSPKSRPGAVLGFPPGVHRGGRMGQDTGERPGKNPMIPGPLRWHGICCLEG